MNGNRIIQRFESCLLSVLCLCLAFFTSCSKDDDVISESGKQESKITIIRQSETVIPQDGGDVTIEFEATSPWTIGIASDLASWCSASPTSGMPGKGTVTISIKGNEEYDERNASINIFSGDAIGIVSITQKQKDALLVTSDKVEIGFEGETTSIEVMSNVEFSYVIDEESSSWIQLSETRGLSTTVIPLVISANSSKEPRVLPIILGGGKGTRLYPLTKERSKPAVSFGGKYRIVDIPLSNCINSGYKKIYLLTQFNSASLHLHITNSYNFDRFSGGFVEILAAEQTLEHSGWYEGTADAIYQNIDFIDSQKPEYVLILSGDHIYKTTYNEMIDEHIKNNAACTISVIEVDWSEASRFGILEVDKSLKITKFVEKPKEPKSNLASMGVYVFTWKDLRKALIEDHKDNNSEHDFGKNIIPTFLNENKKLYAYKFKGYWRDVGTLDSLHKANLELLPSNINSETIDFNTLPRLFSEDTKSTPVFVGKNGKILDCVINQGANIFGTVSKCVISNEVTIKEGAIVKNSVLMPGVVVGKNAYINNAIIAPDTKIKDEEIINKNKKEIVLISSDERSLQ